MNIMNIMKNYTDYSAVVFNWIDRNREDLTIFLGVLCFITGLIDILNGQTFAGMFGIVAGLFTGVSINYISNDKSDDLQ